MDAFDQIAMLRDCGVDVMVQARSNDSADRAGTLRWFIEIDRYPVCFSCELDGGLQEAFDSALFCFWKDYEEYLVTG